MLLNKINVDCDLSVTALECAIESMSEKDNLTLVVSSVDIQFNIYKFKAITNKKLETSLPNDAWYIHGKYGGIYSPGA